MSTGMLMRWLPTLLVILVNAVALTEASSPPVTARGKRLWMIGILLCGAGAIAATVWQGEEAVQRARGESSAVHAFAHVIEQVKTDDGRRIAQLTMRAGALEQQVARLKAGVPARVVKPADAAGLTEQLAKFGSHKVVVSCIPDDIEAYAYANQLVNILKAAKWQAEGPEMTRIFGDVRAIDIGLYAGGGAPDTARILGAAFTRFNIPYRGRITSSEVVAEDDAVELFVGSLPSAPVLSGSDARR